MGRTTLVALLSKIISGPFHQIDFFLKLCLTRFWPHFVFDFVRPRILIDFLFYYVNIRLYVRLWARLCFDHFCVWLSVGTWIALVFNYVSILLLTMIRNYVRLSLWKTTSHTNFIHFAKMVSSNFQKNLLLFWHKFWCIVLNEKEKLLAKKNANHTNSIFGNCMNSIFLMATTKIFQTIFEIVPSNFFCFFQPQNVFCTQTNIFWKKNFACKI